MATTGQTFSGLGQLLGVQGGSSSGLNALLDALGLSTQYGWGDFGPQASAWGPTRPGASPQQIQDTLYNFLFSPGKFGKGTGSPGLLYPLLHPQFSGGFNLGGKGGPGGGGDMSSFMNLFDLARTRAHQGLADQFTNAGGAENLAGPFTTASANLERGLGQTEQGSLVDLYSRLFGPQMQSQTQILGALAGPLMSSLFG